jgi:ribosomal protein S18 acetylase RimI-like enzyme
VSETTTNTTKSTSEIVIRPAVFKDADAIATILWKSRTEAMPWLRVVHSALEMRGWVARTLLKKEDVYVATREGRVVGFASVTPGWLTQLYVHPASQRSGVGTMLLAQARRRLPDGFHFWVFQRNLAARAFYEKHGATLLRETDGQSNEEREPDAEYEWRPVARVCDP